MGRTDAQASGNKSARLALIIRDVRDRSAGRTKPTELDCHQPSTKQVLACFDAVASPTIASGVYRRELDAETHEHTLSIAAALF